MLTLVRDESVLEVQGAQGAEAGHRAHAGVADLGVGQVQGLELSQTRQRVQAPAAKL